MFDERTVPDGVTLRVLEERFTCLTQVACQSLSVNHYNVVTHEAQANDVGWRQQAHNDEPQVCHESDRLDDRPLSVIAAVIDAACHHSQGETNLTDENFLCYGKSILPAFRNSTVTISCAERTDRGCIRHYNAILAARGLLVT